ncbi:MAG: hypothetical protein WCK26_03095 [Candidatus Saccharibacteria bacterium]
MNKQKSQSGFAHLIIIVVILSLALVGLLGFVFYQNIQKNNSSSAGTTPTSQDDTKSTIKYKTFTDDVYKASFKYPDTWTLTSIDVPMAEDQYWNRSLEVKNENGESVAKLILGLSGIGGTCMGEDGVEVKTTYSVLDSSLSSIKAVKSVSASFLVSASNNGMAGYSASYGLTDTYTKVGDYQVCMYYNTFESNLKDANGYSYLVVFGNGFSNDKYFATLDDAKKYIQSDEYKEIKKMLLSLTF